MPGTDSSVPYPPLRIGIAERFFSFCPADEEMDFTEMLVRVRSFPWVKPQEKREATAPAAMAAATEEPVFG